MGEKVNSCTNRLSLQEEKMVNISRLVKLLQSYSDAQEEDNNHLKTKVLKLEEKIDRILNS